MKKVLATVAAALVAAGITTGVVLAADHGAPDPPASPSNVPAAQVAVENDLQATQPPFITCKASNACVPIQSSDIPGALTDGLSVYGLTIHSGITPTMVDNRTPILADGDLTCATTGATLSCTSALQSVQLVPSGEGTYSVAVYQAVVVENDALQVQVATESLPESALNGQR